MKSGMISMFSIQNGTETRSSRRINIRNDRSLVFLSFETEMSLNPPGAVSTTWTMLLLLLLFWRICLLLLMSKQIHRGIHGYTDDVSLRISTEYIVSVTRQEFRAQEYFYPWSRCVKTLCMLFYFILFVYLSYNVCCIEQQSLDNQHP